MAYTFSVNNTPATGSIAIYTLISTLIAAGWTKVSDSDGTTYSAGGTQVTSGNSGANGLGNTRAWVRLRSPATNGGTIVNQQREFTLQRGTIDTDWRVKYSASAGFIGGSPAATVTPSSTDEVFMTGPTSGTDASPSFSTWFGANQTYHWHIMAGGASENYSFIALTIGIGSPSQSTAFFALDVMANGTYPASDVDPAVVYCDNTATPFNTIMSSGFVFSSTAYLNGCAQSRAWMGATSAAGSSITSNSVNVSLDTFNSFGKGQYLGTNPWTNKDDLFPMMWISNITIGPKGIKGFSTLFMCGTINRLFMSTCDTVAPNSRDKISIGYVWLPWDGSAPRI